MKIEKFEDLEIWVYAQRIIADIYSLTNEKEKIRKYLDLKTRYSEQQYR